MGKRHALAGSSVIVAVLLALFAAPAAGVTPSSALRLGVPTVVDPVRGGGEPFLLFDGAGRPWIGAPAGTSTQTSWFWRSDDSGQSFQLLGPSGGHWVCPHTGGGDSLLAYDKASGDMYVTDQEALVSVATGVYNTKANALTASKCLATPAMTADRPFEAILHPTSATNAPQWTDSGHKPIVYMSWLCDACLGGGKSEGGLAYAWSYDGINWHAADPGVPVDTLATDQFYEAPAISNFNWHGTMVVDQKTGYVYTGIGCSGGCPDGQTRNEVGIAIGKPGANRADKSNAGQFASMTYQTAAYTLAGKPMRKATSLFPIISMDSAGTLYEAWIQGDGANDDPASVPDPQEWHLYYTYSKDAPNYTKWAPAQRVDIGKQAATNVLGWMVAGDKGKLGFIWLGSATREQPSKQNLANKWYAFLSVVTNADTANPSFHQARVARAPMNYSDICLQGTLCGVTSPPGNRNMADFVSLDIDPNGALTATYADDANRIAPKVTDLVPGVPVTMMVHQTGGPRLIGAGNVNSPLFWTTPKSASAFDATGDARYPTHTGSSFKQLDLRRVSMTHTTTGIDVHVNVASLASTTSPSSTQPHVWYLVTWTDKASHIWFARAESDSGGALTFAAGAPASYDRPGLNYYSNPTLVDYSGGTAITGSRSGNTIAMHVPAGLVGSPKTGDVLESVTAFTLLDSGLPPIVTAGPGNVPTVVDATPAYDDGLTAAASTASSGSAASGSTSSSAGSSSGGALAATGGPLGLVGLVALVLLTAGLALARARRKQSG